MSTKKIPIKEKEALEKLAYGYDYEERDMTIDKSGKQYGHVRKRHIPPNLQALAMIKKYRALGIWE